jgi:LysM repeat protein
MNEPSTDHRCAAFLPPTSLAASKQQRLCLTPAHAGCATYLASTSARAARVGTAQGPDRASRWAFARTTPTVEDDGGLRARLGALLGDRRAWPAIPAVLLVALLTALGISGMRGEEAVTALASPSQTQTLVARSPQPRAAVATQRPSAPASPEPSPVVTATEPLTSGPTPAPAFRRYRIQDGDTLYGIAAKFHTTVRAISQLNNLATTNLRVGRVLLIPN